MELGKWHQGGWRVADAEATVEGKTLTFTFRPVNAKEFPEIEDYPANFRYTLKIRVTSGKPLPKIAKFEVFTDSTSVEKSALLAWKKAPLAAPSVQAFNGNVLAVEK